MVPNIMSTPSMVGIDHTLLFQSNEVRCYYSRAENESICIVIAEK